MFFKMVNTFQPVEYFGHIKFVLLGRILENGEKGANPPCKY